MRELEFALIGAGFWSQYQLAAWGEVAGGVLRGRLRPVVGKGHSPCTPSGHFSYLHRYKRAFRQTSIGLCRYCHHCGKITRQTIAMQAMQCGVAAICQKPLAVSMEEAKMLCNQSTTANVPLLVHENWRWQAPACGV